MRRMDLLVDDFDYPLPQRCIAQAPLERRDRSRLMVLSRAGDVAHHIFHDLPRLLRAGDLLVLNDTRVIPARFEARRASGGRVEGLFVALRPQGNWEVMLRGAGSCTAGQELSIADCRVRLRLVENLGQGHWLVCPQEPTDAFELLQRVGQTPLPPYIRRKADPGDRGRYQTVYAGPPGAVAAPTAGLHFTAELLTELERAGVGACRLTLHVGPGTFLPVKCPKVNDHHMHAERYELTAWCAEAINAARREGRRVVAVGTTSLRVLETLARLRPGEALEPAAGWTDIFIYPPANVTGADALVTNFHLPRSTLMMLVSAFVCPGGMGGIKIIRDAYAQAVEAGYRFFSYGDAMLIA
jgi:S-adenosylmethionine:tRNA ribosyltransferase-isomerase